ncbi:hypothetical protein MAR_033167, partial [Mya arenaria]
MIKSPEESSVMAMVTYIALTVSSPKESKIREIDTQKGSQPSIYKGLHVKQNFYGFNLGDLGAKLKRELGVPELTQETQINIYGQPHTQHHGQKTTMSDRYYRLVTLLLDISLPALRDLFVHCAKNDPNVTFTTLEGYMNSRRIAVDALLKSKILRKHQFDIVFPTSGKFDETKWDMSLLSSLLLSMFGQTITPVKTEIQRIRDMRNKLSHRSDTSMVETEYNSFWTNTVGLTVKVITHFKGPLDIQKVVKDITSLETRTLDPSKTLEIMNTWYLGVSLENAAEMKQKLVEVGITTSLTSSVLQKATVKGKGRSGKPTKRIKICNPHLEGFKGDFKRNMSRCIQGDFIPPEQVGTIRQKIENDHLATVVGYGESAYLSTVFHAINGSEYDSKFCALLTDPSDWIHVDPDDVQLVVFKDPFGSVVFDQNKATAMFNKLDDIKNSCDDSKLDVIIASKGEILNEAMRVLQQTPDVLEDKIVVYKGTKMSKCYVEDLQKTTLKTSNTNYRTILSKLSDKHCVVLTATDSDGLSKCITYLTADFPSCLTVSHRDDIMHAKLDSAGVVVVVDMAGKYVFDMLKANQWLETFDFMKPMVNNGKPNIAVVMDKARLHECLRKTGMHWIFQNVLEMNPSGGIVDVDVQSVINNELGRPTSVSMQTDPTLRHVADIKLMKRDEDDDDDDDMVELGYISGMTVVEDRLLVAVDLKNVCLRCFDLSTSTQISRYDMQRPSPYDITTLPGCRVAVTLPSAGKIHFLEVKSQSGEFLFINKINVDEGCYGIVYSDDKLILSYKGHTSNNVQILDMEGNVQQ